MLQSFRNNLKGTVATILVILIIIPFALFGVDSLFLNSGAGKGAAEVNGESISESDLRRAILMQKQRLQAQFGENAPAEFFSDERLRDPVLNGMIQRLVLAQEAKSEGMAIADETVDEIILSTPQFQQDGQFNAQMYSQLLRNLGYTPASYRRLLKRDLLVNQHTTGISRSGFVTETELQYAAALSQQTRDFYYLTIPLAGIEENIDISDEQVQQYYDEHKQRYKTPEQVSIEYLEVSSEKLAKDIDVGEEAIREQYEQDVASFEANIRRHAAHILIEKQEDGSEKEKLAQVQKKLKDGENFAALARQYSDDPGSKDAGGDLGFTVSGTFPDAFETALNNLEIGDVSEPVETDAGFHLIKLLAVEGAEPPTFEEDKDRVARLLKRAEAEEAFVDILVRLEDLAYNADNLEEIGNELGLEAKTSDLFDRRGGAGIAANRQVVTAAFSEEVLEQGNTSDVLELSDNHVVVIRKKEHVPEKIKPLDEVKDEIIAQLKQDAGKEQIAAKGAELQKQIAEGKSVEELAKAEDFQWQESLDTRRADPKVNRQLLQHVFTLPKPSNQPEVSGLHLSSGDYVVVSLTEVKPGDFTALASEQQNSLRSRLGDQFGSNDFNAYESLLKDLADIEIH